MLIDFRERERGERGGGEEREGEGEGGRERCKRETSIGCLSYMLQPGTEPAT